MQIKPKLNCIFYLVKPGFDEMRKLERSLASLKRYLPATLSDADLILGIEGDHADYIDLINHLDLRANLIDIPVSSYLARLDQRIVPEVYPHPDSLSRNHQGDVEGFSLGYRYMCRLYSGALYELPILEGYEYCLRLDCDSEFTAPTPTSLFAYANEKNYEYVTLAGGIQYDHELVTLGLQDTARRHFTQHGSVTNRVRFWLSVRKDAMFYTNIELGKLSFFRSESYMAFFKSLDQADGFFRHRWGDAVVKYIAVRTLLPRRKWGYFWNISYTHGAAYGSVENSLMKAKIFALEILHCLPRPLHRLLHPHTGR